MSQQNVEVIERAVAALNARDLDGYLACCTADVQLSTPMVGGVYDGAIGMRRFFADLEDAAPGFRITLERIDPVGADRVLAFTQVRASGRRSGIEMPVDGANVYELVAGQLARIRVFLSREEALKAVGFEDGNTTAT